MRRQALFLIGVGSVLLAGCGERAGEPAYPSTDRYAAETFDIPATPPESRDRYARNDISPVRSVAEAPVSTFAVDVDTGAYANVRRYLREGALPPKDAVRTEEMVNYFRYDYPLPDDRAQPFSVTTDVAVTPWNPDTRLLRIGLRGYDLAYRQRPPANLVFLVDVSGSMDEPDKLPLVKAALTGLAGRLQPRDRVSIVVYAGAAGLVLEPTNDPGEIRDALGELSAGGSTAGGEGLALAYAVARRSFIEGGVNRILVATDGDFNVGITDQHALEEMIEKNRDDGITLTMLGFGRGNLNDAMMESIADKGNGNYAYIDSAMEAEKVLGEEMASTLFTIAGDVKVQVEFNPAEIAQYRLIGYENRALAEQDFADDRKDAGDIGAGHQVTALYEVVPAGAKGWLADRRYTAPAPVTDARRGEIAHLRLRYKLPGETTSRLIERPLPAALLAGARPVQGDMAFVAAVAAFGQKLRGDTLLGALSYADIRRLAGPGAGYWRQEFVELTRLAESGERTARRPGTSDETT